jgi:L-ascorbate metabolism protein UlaG (beta-lactamase superfamily)
MGASPSAIVARVQHSPNFRGGRFQSDQPSLRPRVRMQTSAALAAIRLHDRGRAVGEIPVVAPELPSQAADLAVTWLGHATSLLELDGRRFLLDPVFGERVSPVRGRGPKRMHPAPCAIEDLPPLDAVVISHDHYDHLDYDSIVRLERSQRPRYVVPLGVDLHLLAWGVAPERISALDWRDTVDVNGIRLTCTEARHNSGRGIVESVSLFAGWAFHGPEHSAWFAGDSGTSKRFAYIGADLGPFDLTLVPVGAYDAFWPDIHMDPEQAVAAHRDVNRIGDDALTLVADGAGVADDFLGGDQRIDTPGGAHEEGERTQTTRTTLTAARDSVMLPVHWATFNLAMHWWSEPIRRTLTAARAAGVPVIAPRVGERVDLSLDSAETLAARFSDPWWRAAAAPDDHD